MARRTKGKEEAAAKGKALVAEMRIKYMDDFLKLWNRYYAMFEEGTRSEHCTDEQDAEFRQVKSHVVQLVQMLYESMGSDIPFRKRVNTVITETPSIHILSIESPVKINDIRAQWNEVLIASTKLLGAMRAAADEQ